MKTMTNDADTHAPARAARPLAAASALALFAASQAFAQSGSGPPLPQAADEPPTWLYFIIVGLLVAATVGASLLPSKRGHLD